MKRPPVQLVLLYEDRQHHAFANRFLTRVGWHYDQLYFKPCDSYGALVKRFPTELRGYRTVSARTERALLVLMDEDAQGHEQRRRLLWLACEEAGIAPPQRHERVLVLLPARSIETWLAFLAGQSVDETTLYEKSPGQEGRCHRLVDELVKQCQQRQLREPAPPSLTRACQEYRQHLDALLR